MSLLLVKDTANSAIRELECDTNGLLKVDKVDVSALATQVTLSGLNTKITACDTGAVVVSSSALPSGAANSSEQVSQTAHLSDLAACASAGVLQVSSSSGDISALASWVFGGSASTTSIADSTSGLSTGYDADNYRTVCIAGTTDNTSDTEIEVQVSQDNTTWFDLNDVYMNVDYVSGDFGKEIAVSARYIRIKRSNNSGSSESIKAFISGKK